MKNSLDNYQIRPPNLMDEKSKLYEQDLQLLIKEKLVTVNCPACDSTKYSRLFRKMNFDFVICQNCKTVFVNPRPTEKSLELFYTTSETSKFWDKIFKTTENIRKEQIFKPRIHLIENIIEQYNFSSISKLVEVGAGYGWFCELAKKKNLAKTIVAVEPSPYSADACRKIEGIEVIESTIEKCSDNLNADLIVSFELVHILFSTKKFLEQCFKRLNDNGLLIFSLTNYFGFDIQLLKEKNDALVPTMLTFFNPHSIEILLHTLGFRNIRVITPGKMDVKIILNMIKSGDVKIEDNPFFQILLEHDNDEFISDLQTLIQKYNLSSHMVVSAQK